MAISCATVNPYTPRQVSAIQRSLTEQGYATGAAGVYDARTRGAVAAFQRSHGIAASGEVDVATARALRLDPGAVVPSREAEAQERIQYHAWTDGF